MFPQRNTTFQMNKTVNKTFETNKNFDVSMVIKEVCQKAEIEDEILNDLLVVGNNQDSFDRILPEVLYEEQEQHQQLI